MNHVRKRALAWLLGFSVAALGLIPAPALAGEQPSCGDTITADTTLTGDLDCHALDTYGLTFGASGITLDLGGHTIWGKTGPDTLFGVYTDGYGSVTVRNGRIAHFNTGIAVSGSITFTAIDLRVTGESGAGAGIDVEEGGSNTITGNLIRRFASGIRLYHSQQNRVTWNTLRNASSESIYAEGDYADVVAHNTSEGSGTNRGIYDKASDGQRYRFNTFTGGTTGLYAQCEGSGLPIIRGNTAQANSQDGFYLLACANGTKQGARVTGNTAIHNGGYGFFTGESLNEVWSGNLARHNSGGGFYLFAPSLGTFTGNTSNHNDADGFVIASNAASSNVKTFSSNTANFNNGFGFTADSGAPSSANHADGNVSGDCYNVVCS